MSDSAADPYLLRTAQYLNSLESWNTNYFGEKPRNISSRYLSMAGQLLQSTGVFEITDHTTASDWERFIANLEEILTDLQLHKKFADAEPYLELQPGSISNGLWHERHEILKFGNVHFDFKYQYLKESSPIVSSAKSHDDVGNEVPQPEDHREFNSIDKENEEDFDEYELPENAPECVLDLVSTTNDFASRAHCLVRWYNLRKFIILSPRGDTILSEDKVKLLLSSASVALSNIDCHVPIFFQIHNPKNHFYQGISEHQNIRTLYEMVWYKRNLKQYSHLSDLISVFREKTGCNLNDPITVTVRLNYCLDSFDLFTCPSEEFSGNEHNDDNTDEPSTIDSHNQARKDTTRPRAQDMRSGATFEQVVDAMGDCVPHPYKILKFLHVAAIWPPVSDKVITDTQVHSDLDPAEAPLWTIRCVTSDNCNMKLVHETQALFGLFKAAIDYAYDRMGAEAVFSDFNREDLVSKCLRLSYDLATKPEVVLSESSSDSIRKLVALFFYRQAEIVAQYDALDQLAAELKKKPTLNEIYRQFNKKHKTSVKEFIIRTQISRPFNPKATPALPQRMFCTICDEEFRLCGAFSELCN